MPSSPLETGVYYVLDATQTYIHVYRVALQCLLPNMWPAFVRTYTGFLIYLSMSQDVVNDVHGAQLLGMKGILVKTGE